MEEFGRDVYKLVKVFNAKAKQLRKEHGSDLGQGVRREAGAAEPEKEEEFAPLKLTKTVQEQVKDFKVREALQQTNFRQVNNFTAK